MKNYKKGQTISRNRFIHGLLTASVMLLGLASRRFFGDVTFIKSYVGDGLWALMVFFCLGVALAKWPTRKLAFTAILFSFGIELSQLYHAPWIDTIRATRLGGLVLGFTFVWSDFLCYTIGVLIGILIDGKLTSQTGQSRPKGE